jgi:putative glutathione S-transferase
MGLLVDGKWRNRGYETGRTGGRFVRWESSFRDQVRADGSSGFPPEAGRYHLYVSLACPWAHRTLIARRLLGLESAIGVSVVDPLMGEQGWTFGASEVPGTVPDPIFGASFLYEIYLRADPSYTGRVTVPVLWDRKRATIVNNESSEILRMLEREFDAVGEDRVDLYPEGLRDEIDRVNDFVYPSVNNGVYRCGFATTQKAYEEAFADLFGALDVLESRLSDRRYLVGDRLTEADIRLYTTLVRFDAVYFGHFKCNRQRITDFSSLSGYLRDLYQTPGFAETTDFTHIKRHYYQSHRQINPTGIVPVGPALDLRRPHGRESLSRGT